MIPSGLYGDSSRLPSDAGRVHPRPWLRAHGRAGPPSRPDTGDVSVSGLAGIIPRLPPDAARAHPRPWLRAQERPAFSFMAYAFAEAEAAASLGEVPVGAVIVQADSGQMLAACGNRVETLADPSAHAELLAIRAACRDLGSPRLPGCDLYVTLEPCALCAAAISLARLRRVYFGAYDPKGGAVEHGPRWFRQRTCLHAPDVYGGIDERRAAELLRAFFRTLRL